MNSKRILYLDNLKVFLILLVIIHHAAHAYILLPDWPIKDYGSLEPWLSKILRINMTFFMGAFFFISGYFVPKSKQKRTIKKFVAAKAKRLLIPILSLLFVFVPIYLYLGYLVINNGNLNFIDYYIKIYIGQGNMSYAHGWFILSLFIYCMIYLLLEKIVLKVKFEITAKKIMLGIFIMALVSYFIRKVYPIDTWVNWLGFIGFEPAHFPQYIMLFFAGTFCYLNNWLSKLTTKVGRICCAISTIMIVLLGFLESFPDIIETVVWASFSLYESIMSVCILISLLYLFRKYFNNTDKYVSVMAENAYGTYILHNFFVVVCQVYCYNVNISGNLKFIFVSILSIVFSFSSCLLLRQIKVIRKIV